MKFIPSKNFIDQSLQLFKSINKVVFLRFCFLFCNRRKVPTRTEENGPDPYMDLGPRPEADKTYQEMAITSTNSSQKPGERRLPSSNLIYENQNVSQSANEIKEGADYENVLTPI